MVHLHEVRDTDSHYVIDPVTRAIANANSAKNTLMQGDHNSEIYTFEIPRYVEGHDMTLCNAIRIHFNDISADKANESRDFYPVEDMHLDEVQTGTLVFSWLVSGNATMYAGLLSFRIQFLCINDSGVVTYKWHTDIFKGITISDGFDNSEAAVEEYTDVIAKWEAELFGAGDSVIENIQSAAGEQIASIEEARSAAVSAVEAKGAETLETIPSDYTELYGMANDAVRTRANAIVETVEGNAIVANDCSDDHLRGLRVFGKSEQIKTTGAQLVKIPDCATVTINGITWSCKDGVVKAAGTAVGISSNGGKGMSADVTGLVGTFVASGSVDGVYVYVAVTGNDGTKWYTNEPFTLDGTESSVLVYCQVLAGSVVNATVRPMLNVGTKPLPWEPYTGGVASPSPEYPQEINSVENAAVTISGNGVADQTMVIPRTLHGILVSNGGNYTDANGQQWICDEVDFARGVYVQRIGITDLTEANWAQNSNGKYFSGNNRGVYSSAHRVLCTSINGGASSDGNKENVIFINANNDIRLNITVDNNTVETVTSAMNGAILLGVLVTPVEIALTDAELAAFKALHSNYPNTTVLNDTGAWMEVAYNADTELYFNKSRGASDEQVQKAVDAWLTANLAIAEEVSF